MTRQLEMKDELHETLTAMMAAIENGAATTPEGVGIAELVQKIDAIKVEWGKAAPKMLQHYLEKRSYAKALDFLEGRDETAEPNC